MTTTMMLMNTKVLTTIVPNTMTKQTNSILFTMMVQAATATTTGTDIGVASRKWKQQNQYHYQQSPRILQFLRLDPISKIRQRRDRIIYSTKTSTTRLRMRTNPAAAFCGTTRYSRPRSCCAGGGVSGTGTGGGCASGAGFFTSRNIWRTFSGTSTSITCSSRSTGNSSTDETTTTNNNKNIGVVDQYNPSTRTESDAVVSEDVKSKKEVVLEEESSSSSLSLSVQEEVVVETQKTKSAIGAAAAAASRQKRKMKIGLAKAVDRGYTNITPYMPARMYRYYQEHEQNLNQTQTQTQNQLQQEQQNNYETIQSGYKAISGLPKDRTKPFIVLGIETSCDDTGCAIVRSDGTILGEALASQSTIHEPYGGIVPGLARDAHINTINTIISLALQNANITCIGTQIDAIGVTVGPGLEICLRVGTEKAKELAIQYNKPFVGVHHLEAHILMARLPINIPLLPPPPPPPPPPLLPPPLSVPPTSTTNNNNPLLVYTEPTATTHGYYRTMEFPFLALLVSGGHCQLILCRAIGDYTILGGTIDDSLGEVYDKTARLLGLPIGGGSGGPAIEKLAKLHEQFQQEEAKAEAAAIAAASDDAALETATSTVKTPTAKNKRIQFSVPMQSRRNDCDFSFAGLKSNVRRVVMKLLEEQNITEPIQLPERDKAEIAYAFQNVAIQHLEQRLSRAMDLIEKQEQEQEQEKEQGHDGRIQNTKKIRTLALVGGVAANQQLRKRINDLCTKRSWTMNVPPPRLCTDQGTMSAWAAIERLLVGSSDDPTTQQVYARYPFVSMVDLNTCSTGATLEHNDEK